MKTVHKKICVRCGKRKKNLMKFETRTYVNQQTIRYICQECQRKRVYKYKYGKDKETK